MMSGPRARLGRRRHRLGASRAYRPFAAPRRRHGRRRAVRSRRRVPRRRVHFAGPRPGLDDARRHRHDGRARAIRPQRGRPLRAAGSGQGHDLGRRRVHPHRAADRRRGAGRAAGCVGWLAVRGLTRGAGQRPGGVRRRPIRRPGLPRGREDQRDQRGCGRQVTAGPPHPQGVGPVGPRRWMGGGRRVQRGQHPVPHGHAVGRHRHVPGRRPPGGRGQLDGQRDRRGPDRPLDRRHADPGTVPLLGPGAPSGHRQPAVARRLRGRGAL